MHRRENDAHKQFSSLTITVLYKTLREPISLRSKLKLRKKVFLYVPDVKKLLLCLKYALENEHIYFNKEIWRESMIQISNEKRRHQQ